MPVSWGVITHVGHEGELVDASSDGIFVAFADSEHELPALHGPVSVGVFVDGEGHVVEGSVRWIGRHEHTGQLGMGVAFRATSAYEGEALAFALVPPSVSGVFARPAF